MQSRAVSIGGTPFACSHQGRAQARGRRYRNALLHWAIAEDLRFDFDQKLLAQVRRLWIFFFDGGGAMHARILPAIPTPSPPTCPFSLITPSNPD